MREFFAKDALLPRGWCRDVYIQQNHDGVIHQVKPGYDGALSAKVKKFDGPIIPAMPNLHSHGFQRAFAGLSEYKLADRDSFWTWRKAMYDFAQNITPESLEQIAYELYVDMRKAGYGHVGEFHYLHHQADGKPYQDTAELSHAMIRAAKRASIGITLLPVLYVHSGFGGQPPEAGQARFIHSAESYLKLIDQLHATYKGEVGVKIGAAFHSLRAVSAEILQDVHQGLIQINADMPVHIHIAEQQKEIDDCLAFCGKRPVEYLLDHADVNSNWCLVHATHMNDAELKGLAKSGAVAGLCPTTEASLGDGLFNLSDYIAAGGAFGIGSDSHISVNMIEELRWLEYGQRLVLQRRAIACNADQPHCGDFLYQNALKGGARALGVDCEIRAGSNAKLLELVLPQCDLKQDFWLDSLIFAGNIGFR